MRPLVWDLDGTLVDSAADIQAASTHLLKLFGLPALSRNTVISFIGNGIPKFVERCLHHHGLPVTDHEIETFRTYYFAHSAALTRPYPGVVQCLQNLHALGVKMAVCTNKLEAPARSILHELALLPYFDFVAGGDTFETMKPDPAPIRNCVAALGGGTAIYIGDSETDAAAAANARVTFALFSGGYRKTPVDEMQKDFVFDDFTDLTHFLLSPNLVS